MQVLLTRPISVCGETAAAPDLESGGEIRGGSSPLTPTILIMREPKYKIGDRIRSVIGEDRKGVILKVMIYTHYFPDYQVLDSKGGNWWEDEQFVELAPAYA